MIQVDGYKAFRGTMRIMSPNPKFPQQELRGDWLYIPFAEKHGYWYGGGKSYSSAICEVVEDETA